MHDSELQYNIQDTVKIGISFRSVYLDNGGKDETKGEEDEKVEGRRVTHLGQVSARFQPQESHCQHSSDT